MPTSINTNPPQTQQMLGREAANVSSNATQRSVPTTGIVAHIRVWHDGPMQFTWPCLLFGRL